MDWQSILIAIIGSGVLSTIIVSTKDIWIHLISLNFKSKRNQARDYLKDRIHVYDILNDLKNVIKSPRILILYTENGGGLPAPGSQLFISILYEAVEMGVHSVKPSVQHLLTDEAYDSMLSTLVSKGIVRVHTENLEPGILKKFYIMEGVKTSIVVPIRQNPDKFYYMSVAWKEELSDNDLDRVEMKIISAANNINKLLG